MVWSASGLKPPPPPQAGFICTCRICLFWTGLPLLVELIWLLCCDVERDSSQTYWLLRVCPSWSVASLARCFATEGCGLFKAEVFLERWEQQYLSSARFCNRVREITGQGSFSFLDLRRGFLTITPELCSLVYCRSSTTFTLAFLNMIIRL